MRTATRMRCPRCRSALEKGAAAFVLGWAGVKPKPGDLPASVTCPRCGFALSTERMLAGDFDVRPDWVTPLAGAAGAATAFVWRYGLMRPPLECVGTGLVVFFGLVGAVAVAERLLRRRR